MCLLRGTSWISKFNSGLVQTSNSWMKQMLWNTALHILCGQHYTRSHYARHYTVLFPSYAFFQRTGGGKHQSFDTVSKLEPKYNTVWFRRKESAFRKPQILPSSGKTVNSLSRNVAVYETTWRHMTKGRNVFMFPEACVSRYEQLQVYSQCSCGL